MMPKPLLAQPWDTLEHEVLKHGLHEWRPDLNYPESMSDMQACVRGLMERYAVTRRMDQIILPTAKKE